MQLATLIVLGAAVVGSAIIHLIKVFKELNRSEKIPGPTLLPYIGRIHDLPINFMWLKFKEWADQYSGTNGFYMTEMLGSKYLVLTDEKAAEELLHALDAVFEAIDVRLGRSAGFRCLARRRRIDQFMAQYGI